MADAQTVYASLGSVYVATAAPAAGRAATRRSTASTSTARSARTTAASGQVPGDLLNQFSLSEYKGVLRAATTDVVGRRRAQSYVTVLATRAAGSRRSGRSAASGSGERIYAVRFIGDRGYVVTFRQTDPLYTLDLADPARPRVTGELKILGYSSYLHPVGDDLLLGHRPGRDDGGQPPGHPALALRRRRPGRAARCCSGGRSAGSRPRTSSTTTTRSCGGRQRLAVVPVADYESGRPTQALGFRVDRDAGIDAVGSSLNRRTSCARW